MLSRLFSVDNEDITLDDGKSLPEAGSFHHAFDRFRLQKQMRNVISLIFRETYRHAYRNNKRTAKEEFQTVNTAIKFYQ